MSTSSERAKEVAYSRFRDKVKKTVLLDNLSPRVTESVVRAALEQFVCVVSVEFIPNYTIPYNVPQAALVEMENPNQASSIVSMMTDYPFMMSGMPRPVRARPAKAEMFPNRPSRPGRKIQFRWVEPSDPYFQVAKQLKKLARKHNAETLALIKLQLEEEEKLAQQQREILNANYKKLEMIENIMQKGTVSRLARFYGLNLADE
ncbi:ASI1-immunoprecipitated protein 1-like [Typha angustifolia]|uniref:ASI1-immunoprecipitated protein 1-like n=1 Tax=Typha angustifolia TaxID=59011 RepID=UPI003C2ADF07